MPGMATKERAADRGQRRGEELLRRLGGEIRQARIAAGLSQGDVAKAAGISTAPQSRIERARHRGVSFVDLARILAVVGLDLAAQAYPVGDPLRDRRHHDLLERLLSRVALPLRCAREVPLPLAGDRRAWDALISGEGQLTGIEAEIAVRDLQALQRRVELKRRDGRVDHLILLIAGTRANRAAIRAAGGALTDRFPVGTREVLAALESGRHPSADGIVIL